MSSRLTNRRVLVLFLLVSSGLAIWRVTAGEVADKPADSQAKALAATTDTLGGQDRYLTHVSTDKPIYRPGEKLYVRAVVLHHATHQPLQERSKRQRKSKSRGPRATRWPRVGRRPKTACWASSGRFPTGRRAASTRSKSAIPGPVTLRPSASLTFAPTVRRG